MLTAKCACQELDRVGHALEVSGIDTCDPGGRLGEDSAEVELCHDPGWGSLAAGASGGNRVGREEGLLDDATQLRKGFGAVHAHAEL